jgi:triacylglycerol lipase
MSISDSTAVNFGLLVMYAEDMYTDGAKIPPIDPRVKQAGWEAIAYLTARDAILPKRSSLLPGQKQLMELGMIVFYGFLARNIADPTEYVVAIRGTSGIAEWIIDAEFLPISNPRESGTMVEKGFWNIYESMNLINLDGKVVNDDAAKGIADTVGGTGRVVIAGHSLGAALATYLSLETAKLLGPRLSACLFASPRTGDTAWAALYDSIVTDYRLYNYVLDVVPYVPFDLPPDIQYSTLSKATIIQPSTAQADIRLDLSCDHHVICYCAMLDYNFTKQSSLVLKDQPLWACVIGPHRTSVNAEVAMALAVLVNRLGIAKQIVELLRDAHTLVRRSQARQTQA